MSRSRRWRPSPSTPLQQPSHRPWRRARRQRAPVRLAFENRGDRVRDRLAGKCAAARQHLVQHAPERPDVGPLVDRLAARLLRAHVGRGPENHPSRVPPTVSRCFQPPHPPDLYLFPRCKFRQPKIEHLHHAVGRDLDVRGFQIAMNDPLLVRRVERVGDLARDAEGLGEQAG